MLYNTERPLTFDSFRGQRYIVESIRAQAINQNFFGVYIFGGHFGTGKTSMARTLGLAANCEQLDEHGNPCLKCRHCKSILFGSPDIIEIDAATNTGVDSIRELRDTVNYKPVELKRKVYIIDEVHMLSKGAFNALLKVLEEPPEFVTFILCTTEIGAIPATIRSRGACYFFEQLTCDELSAHVVEVAERNGIVLLEDAANIIAKYSQGAARNALSILDQVSSLEKEVSVEMVQRLLGVSDNTDLFRFAKELLVANTMGAVSVVEELFSRGKDFSLLCDDLIEIVTDTILYCLGGKNTIRNTKQYLENIDGLVSVSSADRLCVLADYLHMLKGELRVSPGKGTVLATVIRLTMDTNNSIIALTERISVLERELADLKASGVSMAYSLTRNSVSQETGMSEELSDEVNGADSETVSYISSEEEWTEKVLNNSVEYVQTDSGVDSERGTEDRVQDDSSEMRIGENCTKNSVSGKEDCESVFSEDAGFHSVDEMEQVPFQKEMIYGILNESEEGSDTETGQDGFDMFDFDVLDVIGSDFNAQTDVVRDEPVVSTPAGISSRELRETAMLVQRMAIENKIFATLLKGCSITEKSDGVHIDTELPLLRTLIEFYRTYYESNGFEVAKNILI